MPHFYKKYEAKSHKRGFTLLELLVVIAVIGLLAAVILAALNATRANARDAARIVHINQMQKALELYFSEHGKYPGASGTGVYYYSATNDTEHGICGYVTGSAPNGAWCKLEEVLAPYMAALPRGTVGNREYLYKYSSSRQAYGLRVVLESPNELSANDGGRSSQQYEVGSLPSYCLGKYSGSDADWSFWTWQACRGGN